MSSDRILTALVEPTLNGLGYELVDAERTGRLIRVFVDSEKGITVEDCAAVSNQLTRLFAVEGVDYDRLEVSSPGLDRPLRKRSDFVRFQGQRVQVKTRVPLGGRKNFAGILRTVGESSIGLDVDGVMIELDLGMLDRARLVPNV